MEISSLGFSFSPIWNDKNMELVIWRVKNLKIDSEM